MTTDQTKFEYKYDLRKLGLTPPEEEATGQYFAKLFDGLYNAQFGCVFHNRRVSALKRERACGYLDAVLARDSK
jgi:hypothetical protein